MGDKVWGKDLKQQIQLINNNNNQYDNDNNNYNNYNNQLLKKDEWIQQVNNDETNDENWGTSNVFNNNNSFDLLSYLFDVSIEKKKP